MDALGGVKADGPHTAGAICAVESADEKALEVDVPRLLGGGLETDELAGKSPADETQEALEFDPAIGANAAREPGGRIDWRGGSVKGPWRAPIELGRDAAAQSFVRAQAVVLASPAIEAALLRRGDWPRGEKRFRL
jgi:hypothetical protein